MSSPRSSIKSAARKLPIKRKSPDPNPNPNLNLTPKFESEEEDDQQQQYHHHPDLKPPPFKFHRIWTEPDEIRFLQGLLDSSTSHNYIFPRDLHLFYDGFSTTMSQPYTKSQLSEKLRRLRRKYRLISSRISHGLDPSRLSTHDQSLFSISKKLWDPNSNANSPFIKKANSTNSVCVEVSFNPSFTLSKTASVPVPVHVDVDDENCVDDDELSDDNVNGDCDHEIRSVVAKAVMDVFDKSLEEVKARCDNNSNVFSWLGEGGEFLKRIREQRIAELDVVAQRMRLVLENSVRYP